MAEKLTAYFLMHRLWTKAVGTSEYIKAEWRVMERMIYALEEREKLLADVEQLMINNPGFGLQMIEADEGIVYRIKNRKSMNPRDYEDLPSHVVSHQHKETTNP